VKKALPLNQLTAVVLSVRPFIYANLWPFSAILFPSKIPQNIFLLTFCRFITLWSNALSSAMFWAHRCAQSTIS
jgi:hypothetical protein